MSGDIILFPAPPAARFLASMNAEVSAMGTPEEWLATAVDHLKVRSGNQTEGEVTVWVSALHLVLIHLEELQRQAGLIGSGDAA